MSEQVAFFRLEDDAKAHTNVPRARRRPGPQRQPQRPQAPRPRAVANGGYR